VAGAGRPPASLLTLQVRVYTSATRPVIMTHMMTTTSGLCRIATLSVITPEGRVFKEMAASG